MMDSWKGGKKKTGPHPAEFEPTTSQWQVGALTIVLAEFPKYSYQISRVESFGTKYFDFEMSDVEEVAGNDRRPQRVALRQLLRQLRSVLIRQIRSLRFPGNGDEQENLSGAVFEVEPQLVGGLGLEGREVERTPERVGQGFLVHTTNQER